MHTTIKEHGLRAEVVASLAGQVLKAPLPGGAICRIEDVLWWCSHKVESEGWWTRSYGAMLNDRMACARLVALDILICNEDRHEGNLLLSYNDDGHILLTGIDHEEAWIGRPQSLVAGQKIPVDKYPETFIHQDGVLDGVLELADEIAAIKVDYWDDIARATQRVLPNTDTSCLSSVLHSRSRNFHVLAQKFIKSHRMSGL